MRAAGRFTRCCVAKPVRRPCSEHSLHRLDDEFDDRCVSPEWDNRMSDRWTPPLSVAGSRRLPCCCCCCRAPLRLLPCCADVLTALLHASCTFCRMLICFTYCTLHSAGLNVRLSRLVEPTSRRSWFLSFCGDYTAVSLIRVMYIRNCVGCGTIELKL